MSDSVVTFPNFCEARIEEFLGFLSCLEVKMSRGEITPDCLLDHYRLSKKDTRRFNDKVPICSLQR